MSYFLAFAGFALLIILHEFGHFAAAKAVGMRVEKFSLFFGPSLVSRTRGETVYAIGSIPLGGYVRITGMNPNEEIPEEIAHRAYYRQPVWKRIVVISAGPVMNVIVAFLILFGLFSLRGPDQISSKVAAVEAGQPAQHVLKTGDRILSVDGTTNVDKYADQISSHHCAGKPTAGCTATTPVRLVVDRGGKKIDASVYPRYDAGAGRERTRIGFGFGTTSAAEPVLRAAKDSVNGLWSVTSQTATTFAHLFTSSKARHSVRSVVGTYETTREVIQKDGITQALVLLAIISLSLAIVNLFPFLPLDGGHIFWALSEKVRGRPIAFSALERASAVGFVLIIALFALGLSNDIGRLSGAGFGVR